MDATHQWPAERPARPWELDDAPSADPDPPVPNLHPPPPPPPPQTAVDEEGSVASDTMANWPVYYYRDGHPVYFPFHPTTDEWAACDAAAERACDDVANG